MVTTISNVRTAYTAGVLKQSFIAFEGLVEECKERGIVLRQRLLIHDLELPNLFFRVYCLFVK